MNFINEEAIQQLLKQEGDSNKITALKHEITEHIVDDGTGSCRACQLTLSYLKNGEICKKSCFLKIPSNGVTYESMKALGACKTEPHMYESVLPRFHALLPEESFAPEHYYTGDKETLILEDIRLSGYKTCEKSELLDFEHTACALRLLAKFHAASVGVEQTTPKILDAVREDKIYTADFFKNQMQMMFEKKAEIILNRENLSGANDSSDPLFRFRNQILPRALDEMKRKSNSFNVLNHGDFWTSNMMFKYDAYGCVENVKFVDFQMCRWTSPAVDLLSFFINSVRFEIFEKYFDLLLQMYVNTLNGVLKYLKCDRVYEIDDLYKDIESKYNFWIFTLIFSTSMIFFDPEKGSPFDVRLLEDERFVRLSRNWISYFKRKGVFPKKLEHVPVAVDTSK